MRVLHVPNVESALMNGVRLILADHVVEDSRNGIVKVCPQPVTTVYARPEQRVLFCPVRNANPFFHYMESLWMLAGRNDAKAPGYYAEQIKSYANEDGTLDGAYGYRWRWPDDQIAEIVKQLSRDRTTRRAVLQMWEPHDLFNNSLDKPCNTACMFRVRDRSLDMVITCRSNDAIWGAYGANAVHFSILQEYIAKMCGLSTGLMYQMSANLHIYAERPDVKRYVEHLQTRGSERPAYAFEYGVEPAPTPVFDLADVEFAREEATSLMETIFNQGMHPYADDYRTSAARTGVRMHNAYAAYKAKDFIKAMSLCSSIEQEDWRAACGAWLARREEAHNAKH